MLCMRVFEVRVPFVIVEAGRSGREELLERPTPRYSDALSKVSRLRWGSFACKGSNHMNYMFIPLT